MKQLNQPLRYLTAIIVAIVVAIASAWFGINAVTDLTSVRNGIWQENWSVGSKSSNMYTRAFIALNGLFALNKSETIYFNAVNDAEGKTLSTQCDYKLEGKDIAARWWSITAYGKDRFLIANPINRYSFSGAELIQPDRSQFTINLSAEPKPGNWLPIGHQGSFQLTLRLYMPESIVYDNLESYELPHIVKERCR